MDSITKKIIIVIINIVIQNARAFAVDLRVRIIRAKSTSSSGRELAERSLSKCLSSGAEENRDLQLITLDKRHYVSYLTRNKPL